MGNKSDARVPMSTRKQRRRRRHRTAISDQNNIRHGGLDRGSANKDSKEDRCEETELNQYAASLVKQKELEEILERATEGENREYLIFITNLCAIIKFCLERIPSLQPNLEAYVESHIEYGHALLMFILEGPHSSLIPQKNLSLCWNKARSEEPESELNPVEQQPEALSFSIPVQDAAGPNFVSYRQQPPQGLTTEPAAPAPALAPAPEKQNPLPTTQLPSVLQPRQVSQYASNAVHQGSSDPAQLLPASSTEQQSLQDVHPVGNPRAQPVMTQPFQMHNAEQSHATPLNFASKQSQTPAAYPAPTQVHASQLTGLGWAVNGQSQVPPLTMQSQQGPDVLNSSAQQPATFPSGPPWVTDSSSSTQISSQATAPVQQGDITYPTQSWFESHDQPGPLHMFTQPSETPTGTPPNPLWPGSSQEGHIPANEFFPYNNFDLRW